MIKDQESKLVNSGRTLCPPKRSNCSLPSDLVLSTVPLIGFSLSFALYPPENVAASKQALQQLKEEADKAGAEHKDAAKEVRQS